MSKQAEEIGAYSPRTDTHYRTFDDLVAAEASGWVVLVISERPGSAPGVFGPFETKVEARAVRDKWRPRWRRDERPHRIHTYVRTCWQEPMR